MSEETREPQTFTDLWLMCETSNAWFDGALRFEDVRKGADPEVGAVDSVYWRVVPTSDCVWVRRDTHVICDVKDSGRSCSCKVEGETVAEYRSMDDFRASEWWDLTMEKFAGGDADASWPRTVDRDALLELVKELELGAQCAVGRKWSNAECERMAKHLADDYEMIARRIREALGMADE